MTVEFIGESDCIRQVKEKLEKVALAPYSVFLYGETGVGKYVAARYVHSCSDKADGPFVSVDCTVPSAELLPNEIFGHEKGAYTGADKARKGKVEMARGGYIFFDEFMKMIGVHGGLSLLGFLGDGRFSRLGDTREHSPDVRVIAADSLEGGLPKELHRRFTSHIRIPPLRDRKEDIVLLAEYFSRRTASEMGSDYLGFSMKEEGVLTSYPWPENIGQLEQTIRRRYIDGGGLDFAKRKSDNKRRVFAGEDEIYEALCQQARDEGLDFVVDCMEKSLIERAIDESGGHLNNAAKLLGISFRSFRYRTKKLGIDCESKHGPKRK